MQEAEAGELQILGQPMLHSEALSQTDQLRKRKRERKEKEPLKIYSETSVTLD